MELEFFEEQWKHFRKDDINNRLSKARLTIDPGFVHHRKIETILGEKGRAILNNALEKYVSKKIPEGLQQTQIDHVYTDLFMQWCGVAGVKALGQVLSERKGRLFCSTEIIEPCPTIYDTARVKTEVNKYWGLDTPVFIEFSTDKVRSDTLRSRLCEGDQFSIIAELHSYSPQSIIFDPIIIGAPWFESIDRKFDLTWNGYVHNEIFIEDIDEFSAVKGTKASMEEVLKIMPTIPEKELKRVFCKLLNVDQKNDWGGEQSDIYSANMHIQGERASSAFFAERTSTVFSDETESAW